MVDRELLTYLEGFLSEGRKARIKEVLANRTRFLTVAVEDVYQLHNTSAVLRSCEVFGIQDLHLISNRFKNRPDRKIAMGAQQWIDMYRYQNAGVCIEALRINGYRLVATTPAEGSGSLEEFRLSQPTALFFGTEKEGLSDEILRASDEHLRIPMMGFTESFNISVAAAIILYKLTSDLRNSGNHWKLSDSEVLEKRMEWTRKSIKSAEAIIDRYYAAKTKPQT